jgi:SpoVK/Ycf46/Vps4 family AAA+-type ATPase
LALVKSHFQGDDDAFGAVAQRVVQEAARAGRTKFARELGDFIDSVRVQPPSFSGAKPALPFARRSGETASPVSVSYPDPELDRLVLSPKVEQAVMSLLAEQRDLGVLAEHRLPPARKMLLAGPPGTGKTSAARAVAGELALPLFSVRIDSLADKSAPQAAADLRLVFDRLSDTRAVCLFNGVDELAGDRDPGGDSPTGRRPLDSFLELLDADVSDCLVFAATNSVHRIDSAAKRLFDAVVTFSLPDEVAAKTVAENRLASFDLDGVDWSEVTAAAAGLSHGDICVAAENAAKLAVLSGHKKVDTLALVAALENRPHRVARDI